MIGPLKAVSAAIRKLRRRKRLSTELHSRWGDVSITYPNEGSWSQWDQPSGTVVNAADSRSEKSQSQRHPSWGSQGTGSRPLGSLRQSASGDEASGTIPTRHYDAGLRRRSRKKHQERRMSSGIGDSANGTAWWDTDTANRSDSEDESPTLSPRGRRPAETVRATTDDAGSPQRAPRSPPLSVTSRMRRHSQHSSTATEPTGSMPGTASSQTTSFAASSASGTDDPRLGYNAVYQEKKQQLRAKYNEDPVLKQELVPSYDELYG